MRQDSKATCAIENSGPPIERVSVQYPLSLKFILQTLLMPAVSLTHRHTRTHISVCMVRLTNGETLRAPFLPSDPSSSSRRSSSGRRCLQKGKARASARDICGRESGTSVYATKSRRRTIELRLLPTRFSRRRLNPYHRVLRACAPIAGSTHTRIGGASVCAWRMPQCTRVRGACRSARVCVWRGWSCTVGSAVVVAPSAGCSTRQTPYPKRVCEIRPAGAGAYTSECTH